MRERRTCAGFVAVAGVAGGIALVGIAWQWQGRPDAGAGREIVPATPGAGRAGGGFSPAAGGSERARDRERTTGGKSSEFVAVTLSGPVAHDLSAMRDWDAESIRERFGLEKRGDVWLPATTLVGTAASSGGGRAGSSGGGGAGEYDGGTPLYLTTGSFPPGVTGEPYRVSLEAVGGILPYRWKLVEGALPEGLVLDPIEGVVSGTAEEPGDSGFRVRVTDAGGRADLASFTITVEEPGTLRILTESLTEARRGEMFSESLLASGGSEPYAWSVESALPAGILLESAGSLEGRPEVEGTFRLLLRVEDAEGSSATGLAEWTISGEEREGVTNFEALRSLRRVALSWTPPAGPGGARVRIVRNGRAFPESPEDGIPVYSGSESSVVDRGLDPGRYFYAAFVEGGDPVETPPARLVVDLSGAGDPFVDAVASVEPLSAEAFQANLLPGIVAGPPRGGGLVQGSSHVFSLGAATNDDGGVASPYGGGIVVEFVDNEVWNGPGADFTVFENVFYIRDAGGNPDPDSRFMEPAVVSVSEDGTTFVPFPFDFSPRFDPETGDLNLRHPFVYNRGFAGVNPVLSNGYDPDPADPAVSGGDSFDIGELGLERIRFVRIQSTGNRWLVDRNGDLVLHTEEAGSAMREFNRSGFDFDAVGAIWIGKSRQEP